VESLFDVFYLLEALGPRLPCWQRLARTIEQSFNVEHLVEADEKVDKALERAVEGDALARALFDCLIRHSLGTRQRGMKYTKSELAFDESVRSNMLETLLRLELAETNVDVRRVLGHHAHMFCITTALITISSTGDNKFA
jgi:hypothetical protein